MLYPLHLHCCEFSSHCTYVRGESEEFEMVGVKKVEKMGNTKAAAADFVASELHFAITALFNLELSTQKLAGCNHPLLAPPTMDE